MTDKKITKQIRNLYWKDLKRKILPIWILIIVLIASLLIGIFINQNFFLVSAISLFGLILISFKKIKIMKKEITINEKIDFLILERNTLENSLFKNKELKEKYENLRELERQKGELLNNVEGVDNLIKNVSV